MYINYTYLYTSIHIYFAIRNKWKFCIHLLARQLFFAINSSNASLGTLVPFDWGTIEAKDLKTPPSDARSLVLVAESKEHSLFVDGEKPFTSEIECTRMNNEHACTTNCPESERGANGSFISRHRRALICLKSNSSIQSLKITCSVPCPAWMLASPHIVWIINGTVVLSKIFVFLVLK